ncbi:methylenetetrahydrofolate reductase [NAD(P)H] [Hyphobacterium marinum]|uniref:Methylenetetrahydrofolate reductase n=1 Tax=Hyphobacterium marinum TaxID=3116574 RepID=A0ABU7LWY0_9PROT|nr:methylenetetrahydrofolate reductase [NAD(P)H] [Hyphobacterium sp. Y6023]MEE2566078.1 methylenetetrahydrofolate reductase [NAD(P)H] [Hyphobacterium sp. Y6023]
MKRYASATEALKANGSPSVSFEFFPPKSDAMEERLWDAVTRLEPYGPAFVSVTYGAGGSTRERTHRTVRRIASETRLNAAAHLTCVGATKAELDAVIDEYAAVGVKHIVALRGDSPDGAGAPYASHPGGYESTPELVAAIRRRGDFDVSVGCYPECHPDSPDLGHDIDVLKAKADAGATRAITQFFFDPDVFFRFRDRAVAAGITIPIIPGLMLQSNFEGLKRMSGLCKASIPAELHDLYDGLENDAEARDLVTANVAAKLARKLAQGGVEHFHFYTLNRAGLAISTCRLLGVKAAAIAA